MTARKAVIEAMRHLERRHGRAVFEKGLVAQEAHALRPELNPSTISTHISSHMVKGSSQFGWADLERVNRGHYRLLQPTRAGSRQTADAETRRSTQRNRQRKPVGPIPDATWSGAADRLRRSITAGFGHLLTEDSLRWAVIESLGGDPESLEVGYPDPVGGRIDLVSHPLSVAIEFKFPRLTRRGNPPFTQHVGALAADFLTVHRTQGFDYRFVVELLLPEFERHLRNRRDIRWVFKEGGSIEFDPSRIAHLPQTARRDLPSWALDQRWEPFTAHCVASHDLGIGCLVAYTVP